MIFGTENHASSQKKQSYNYSKKKENSLKDFEKCIHTTGLSDKTNIWISFVLFDYFTEDFNFSIIFSIREISSSVSLLASCG
jgi:hypothetical protein